MIFPEILCEDLMDEVVGIIFVHLYFFEDHAALAGDVIGVEDRMQHQIAENIKGDRNVLVDTLMLKQMHSLAVKASMLPPMESTWRAISSAVGAGCL